MAKLTKRQIIIICIMAIVVIYGVYALMLSPRKGAAKAKADQSSELKTFIVDVSATMAKDTPTANDVYMVALAETAWKSDPFYERKFYREWSAAKEGMKAAAPKITFNYAGYIDTGKKQMAIVNGIEYGVGDSLEIEGYILRSITPSKVVIENRTDRTRFDVPFQE
jgi:hypothetical protein